MTAGSAPKLPYHHDRCLYRFRFHYDYSGGQVTNFGAHSVDMARWGMGLDGELPTAASCSRAKFLPEGSLFNTALETDFVVTHADGREITTTSSEPKVQVRFNGTDGWLQTGYGGTTASRDELLKGAPAHRVPKGALDPHSLHMRNFLRAIGGDEEQRATAQVGHGSAVACHLANAAIKAFPQKGENTATLAKL